MNDSYKIHAEYESTGIKKLIQLFAYLNEMVEGGIVFIDEFDSNIHSKASKGNKSKVIYCFDCDEYDNKIEDLTFLKTVKKYCDDRGYDFIWFCKDVEQVYIGKRVDNSKKKNESTKFKKNNLITKVDVHRLSGRDYRIKTSNIMTVLDSYQELKRK